MEKYGALWTTGWAPEAAEWRLLLSTEEDAAFRSFMLPSASAAGLARGADGSTAGAPLFFTRTRDLVIWVFDGQTCNPTESPAPNSSHAHAL